MANVRRGNTWYLDSTGAVSTDYGQRVAYIVFTPNSVNDTFELRETSDAGTRKLKIKDAADNSQSWDFSNSPIVFNGIYVQTLTSGASLTLVMIGD